MTAQRSRRADAGQAPPKSRRVAYYIFGVRALKPADRAWLKDDIESGRYFARHKKTALVLAPILAVIGWLLFRDPFSAAMPVVLMGMVVREMGRADPVPAAARLLGRCDKRWAKR